MTNLTSFYLHSTGTPIKYTADINQYMHQLESLTSLHEGEKASNNFPKHLHLFYAELINYLSWLTVPDLLERPSSLVFHLSPAMFGNERCRYLYLGS